MALAPELAGLAAFVACLILLGIYFAYTNTIGALTGVLASLFLAVSIPTGLFGSIRPLKFIADGIVAIDNGIKAALLAGIDGTKWAYTNLFHLTAYAVQEVGAAIHGLAADTENALGILTRHKIAVLIAAALIDPLSLIGVSAAGLVALERRLGTVEGVLRRDIAGAEQAAARAEGTAVHAIAVDLPALGRKARDDAEALIRPIGNEIGNLGKRITGLAHRVGPAAIVGLVAAAVGSLGMTWTRCSRASRWGKQVCAMDDSYLESLIADSLLIVGTIDLAEFANGMRGIVREVAKDTAKFWRA